MHFEKLCQGFFADSGVNLLILFLFSLFKKYRDLSAGGIRGFQWMGVSHLAIKDVNALMEWTAAVH